MSNVRPTTLSDTKLVNISGVGRPSRRLRQLAKVLHGNRMADAVETMAFDMRAVNVLADAIGDALVASTNASGNVDLKDTAFRLIQWMKENQR